MSTTNGSSGFASVSNEHMDNKILDIVKAGLQFSFKISKHISPSRLILQWYIFVVNRTFGGLNGYSSENKIST